MKVAEPLAPARRPSHGSAVDVAMILAIMGFCGAAFALYRLQLQLVSQWTHFAEVLGARLTNGDRDGAQSAAAQRPGSVMTPLALAGLALLDEAPDTVAEAEPFFAKKLAPHMLTQIERVRAQGLIALIGTVPTAAMGLGLQYNSNAARYVAFAALLQAGFGLWRAHVVRTRIVPKYVAKLIGVLAEAAAGEQ